MSATLDLNIITPTKGKGPTRTDLAHSAWMANLVGIAVERANEIPVSTLQIANLQAIANLFDAVMQRAFKERVETWDHTNREGVRLESERQGLRFIAQIENDRDVPQVIKEEFTRARRFVAEDLPRGTVRYFVQ